MPKEKTCIELQEILKPNTLYNDESKSTTGKDSHEEINLAHQDDNLQRPSIRGPFRPIRNGTIRGSIFAMMTSALGSGCLNLPYRVSKLGIFPFSIVLLLCAFLSYIGMYFMQRIIVRYKVSSYSQMVQRAFGQKIKRISQIILIGYPCAICISLQVIFSKFAMQLLADVFGLMVFQNRQREIYNGFGNFVRVIIALLNITFNFRNFFEADLRELLHSLGKFSITGVVLCLACIVWSAITGFERQLQGETIIYDSIFTMNYDNVQMIQPFTFSTLLQSLSGIFYTFLNHQYIFPLISHLKKPTKKRVDRIFKYTHVQMISIYLCIAIFGYLLLSQHEQLIPISPLIIASIPTVPLLLGKFILTVAFFFALPLQVFTARQFTYQALDLQRDSSNMARINYVIVGATCMMSILFQEVTAYFGFIGGSMGIMMAVIIPAACMKKLIDFTPLQMVFCSLALILSLFLFVGSFLSLVNHP